MRITSLCALLLLCAGPLCAKPSDTVTTADDRLRAWLAYDTSAHEKINKVQGSPTEAVLVDEDLKDAVADKTATPEEQRREMIARLPGLKAQRQIGCKDFATCDTPPLAVDLKPGESVEVAIRAMVRPWIWLADARGVRLGVAPTNESASVLAMNIKELGISRVDLNIASRPDGGVHLWFSKGPEIAALYSKERGALATPKH